MTGYFKLATFLATLLLATPAGAQESGDNPFSYIDGTAITITGTVAAVIEDQFTLDYGEGVITVEMDDGEGFLFEAEDVLVPGERVTVSGIIDDDLFEERAIEAGSVYIHDQKAHYLSSMLDREKAEGFLPAPQQQEPVLMTVVGTVVDMDEGALIVDTGAISPLRVETGNLLDDLLGVPGSAPVLPGDPVRVTGMLHSDLEGNSMEAHSISLERNIYE